MKLILVLDNVRSAHNVGTLWRSAEAAGVEAIWTCGITPHPPVENDQRPAYVAERARQQIAKTALGAETSLPFRYFSDISQAVEEARTLGYKVYALEQSTGATTLFDWQPELPAILVVGHETDGVSAEGLKLADQVVEIPMLGRKESLNVAAAGSVALYWALSKTSAL